MKDFFYVIGIIVSILIILSQAFVVYVFAGLHWIIGLIVLFIFIVIDLLPSPQFGINLSSFAVPK